MALTCDFQVYAKLGVLQQHHDHWPLCIRYARGRHPARDPPVQGNIRISLVATNGTSSLPVQYLQIFGLGIRIIALGLTFYARGKNATYGAAPPKCF